MKALVSLVVDVFNFGVLALDAAAHMSDLEILVILENQKIDNICGNLGWFFYVRNKVGKCARKNTITAETPIITSASVLNPTPQT